MKIVIPWINLINLQLPVVILKKSIISDMQHRKTYNYFNLQQNWVSRSVKTMDTNVFATIRSVKTVHTNLFANNHKLH